MIIPRGFLFATEEAAIKKPGRDDLALIYSTADAVMAGAFTTNKIKGAPVKLCLRRIRSGEGRAIVINSGNANVCTGPGGLKDAARMAREAARELSIGERLVYVCSTGVIGTPLPMERVMPGLKRLAAKAGSAGLEEAARAIMTTDTFPKIASKRFRAGGKEVRLAAIAKGAGMIRPDMATMLCFVITDMAIGRRPLAAALKNAVEGSFNRISVDGETSTSDTVLIMANGLAGNPLVTGTKSAGFVAFKEALDAVTSSLARMIVKDGEGATKLVEIELIGAASAGDALKGAFAIAHSPLVKTAIYGNDANWGRIMSALGASGIRIKEQKVDIFLERLKIVAKGTPLGKDKEAEEILKKNSEIKITVNLNLGPASRKEKVLTCDLTEEYVKINARYRT